MISSRHLLHPRRTVAIALKRWRNYFLARRFARESQHRFSGDPRYDLRTVAEGFAERRCDGDDAALLNRICDAYEKAVTDQCSAPPIYQATGWWRELQRGPLRPVQRALAGRDLPSMRTMYGNFFRDPCSTGLVPRPYGLTKSYSAAAKEMYLHSYLGDALHRIDYWASQLGSEAPSSDLAGPEVGNPFGVVIDGTLIRAGAAYQHYCARKLLAMSTQSGIRSVVEIGGGYGGMAYYLLRDGGELTYIDFDTPESIALTAYYLLKALPEANCTLYGERDVTEACAAPGIVLMPLFAMERMPAGIAELTFSSHAMSDLTREAASKYLQLISGFTRAAFLYAGGRRGADRLSVILENSKLPFRLTEQRRSEWDNHKAQGSSEVECLYWRELA